MRLWSIHPKYLDSKGLVALWREALLAQAVLTNKTRGYKNHPQLNRFKPYPNNITHYLHSIVEEASNRSYNFDAKKIDSLDTKIYIPVTTGQVEYELTHLKNKLIQRCPQLVSHLPIKVTQDIIHPLFQLIEGDIEPWEIT